jgi:hypothetical protein
MIYTCPVFQAQEAVSVGLTRKHKLYHYATLKCNTVLTWKVRVLTSLALDAAPLLSTQLSR